MSEEIDTSFGPPPPPEQRAEARTVLPMPPPYVRTLADRLPDGLSDPGVEPPPPLKLPEPLVLVKPREPQEPAFGRITRVGLGDEPQLAWVIDRLIARYPEYPPTKWRGWLRSYMNVNETFFRRTERAIVLAVAGCDSFQGAHVLTVFVLHQDIGPEGGSVQHSQGEREAITLVRELRNWARMRRAEKIIGLEHFSDLTSSVYVQRFRAERRETVWIPLK